ncbi:hypothetical protein, partial [Escherichia coli]|uniref:hypothetical protein n=1 Tax=Escherichia coli TaxID=562 RepID=UPI0025544CB8
MCIRDRQGIEKKYNHDINPLVISEFKNVYKRKFKSIILIYLRRYAFYNYYKKIYKNVMGLLK